MAESTDDLLEPFLSPEENGDLPTASKSFQTRSRDPTRITNVVSDSGDLDQSEVMMHRAAPLSPEMVYEKSHHRQPIIMSDSESETDQSESTLQHRSGGCLVYGTVAVLVFVNLLNYMDRFTLAGVLIDIQSFYGISNSDAGLLQTSFILSYMVLAPLFGYLGDRYNRKFLMAAGILFWSGTTLAGSFIPKEHFWLFLFMRAMVGIGEASYSTIAPTIIADMFTKDRRTTMLTFFYFATPVGSGLGFIVGTNVAKLLGAWQWALRVTPILGVVAVILILLFVPNPPRGEADGGNARLTNTSFLTDLKQLCRNGSFMLDTAGFTCVSFVTGALALWAPSFIAYAMTDGHKPTDKMQADIALIFGGITCAAGVIGTVAGAEWGKRWKKSNPTADPLVCAIGMLGCTPFLYFALLLSRTNIIVTYVLVLIGEIFLCLNWTLVADIVLYVVIPTRRSTAEAVQIVICHLLGDAGSPYLIGIVSDAIASGHDNYIIKYQSLKYALLINTFVCVIGGAFFLGCAFFIVGDRARADRITRGEESEHSDLGNNLILPVDPLDSYLHQTETLMDGNTRT
ncbi:protein spinster homolog 1-like isoform X3 [Branchiostoma floridae]|uniref:Protein spinster homolog 1-like isoform X3 n=1 Tax=Branchiostoma floridae TaxID=7739 RepID=A0A9J7M0W6_BRAFL|nr:protein spinster homolog 1-like isoform X3 [Branchiostoma floridae]